MEKPRLEDVLAEVERKHKQKETMKPIWAFIACMAAGFILYVFGEGLGVVFG